MPNDHACEGEWPGHIPVDMREIDSVDNKQPEAGLDTYEKEERHNTRYKSIRKD